MGDWQLAECDEGRYIGVAVGAPTANFLSARFEKHTMNSILHRSLAAGVGLWLTLFSWHASYADQKPVLRQNHPWGRFKPGAWKRVRLHRQTVDTTGQVTATSTQETLAQLRAADEQGYALLIERSVNVGGKVVNDAPQEWRGGYCEEVGDETATVVTLGAQKVEINDATIDTEVREIVVQHGGSKRVQRINYSDRVAPYVLRRVNIPDENEGRGQKSAQLAVDVLALEMPYPVLGELRTAAYVRTVHKAEKTTTTTVEVFCGDVPGGVVAHSSVIRDDQGRVIERSTLELLGFDTNASVKPETNRLGRLGRRRN